MLGYSGALATCAVALVVAVPVAAQESINHASVSGRVSDSQGAVVPGATVTARQVETDVSSSVRQRRRRALPVSLPPGRHLRPLGAADRVRRGAPPNHGLGRRRLRDSDRAGGGRRGRQRDRRRRSAGARVGSQPDCGHRLGGRGAERCRSTAATSSTSRCSRRACRRPTSTAPSCSPRPRPCRASACRSAVSATCRTASSWTGCRPTTMRPV